MAEQANLVKLTGLWKGKTAGGVEYLAGDLSPTCRVVIFANTKKDKDSQPDYNVYVAAKKPKEKA